MVKLWNKSKFCIQWRMRKTNVRWWVVMLSLLPALVGLLLWLVGWTCGILFGAVSDGFNRGFGRQVLRLP